MAETSALRAGELDCAEPISSFRPPSSVAPGAGLRRRGLVHGGLVSLAVGREVHSIATAVWMVDAAEFTPLGLHFVWCGCDRQTQDGECLAHIWFHPNMKAL